MAKLLRSVLELEAAMKDGRLDPDVTISMTSQMLTERRMERYMPGVEPIWPSRLVRAIQPVGNWVERQVAKMLGREAKSLPSHMRERGMPNWRQQVSLIAFDNIRADLEEFERRWAVRSKRFSSPASS